MSGCGCTVVLCVMLLVHIRLGVGTEGRLDLTSMFACATMLSLRFNGVFYDMVGKVR